MLVREIVFGLLVGSSLVVSGCKGSEGSSAPESNVVTFGIEPFEVATGEDRIWCKTMKVPSDVTLDVRKWKITMPEGSHHFILYRSEANLPDGFGACTEMNDRVFVTASQTAGSFETEYPAGLALPLFAGEQLILETHYANATGGPITAQVEVEAHTMAHEDVTDYVQTVLAPYTDFSIPPMTNGYTDGASVNEAPGFKVIAMSSHTHSRATLVTIDRTVGGVTSRVFENTDWHAPVIKNFSPPLEGASGNSLRLECTWNNETDAPITFGPTTDDEMCIAVLTFYPAYSYSP